MSPARRPLSVCGHCGQSQKCSRMILGQAVCGRCVQRFARAPKTCPGCGEPKVLAFYDPANRPACATCTGNPAVYACRSCGREDRPFGRRCAPCVLAERANLLLAGPAGAIHPELQPVFDALIAARRPQTVLYWLTRSEGPNILAAMARGEINISHQAFEQLPSDRTMDYLRGLLVAVGVLPAYHPRLERITPWLAATLDVMPAGHAELVDRFARWHVLRRLRRHEQAGTLTPGAISAGRGVIVATVRFTAWLDRHDHTLATLTQPDLDRYTAEYPQRRDTLTPFIRWAVRSGLAIGIDLPTRQPAQPHLTLSDTQRWEHVELLLHDQTIRLYTRVAGLFMLLFAQPVARISAMKTSQIAARPDRPITVTFDTFLIELPEPLDRLVVDQLASRGHASYPNRPGRWLFPGAIPGRHLVTENIRSQLVERGIQPSQARKAAMFQLAAEIPTPILADILGLGTTTATRWATLASRDWAKYTALRVATNQDTAPLDRPSVPGHSV